HPAARGTLVTLYATGEGITDPAATEGRLADAPYPTPVAPVGVTIGGQPAEIASLASGVATPGVLQMVVRVPPQAAAGTQLVVFSVGGVSSQKRVTLTIR